MSGADRKIPIDGDGGSVHAVYREQLLKSYGSLTDPVFHFVWNVADRKPYGEVFRRLSSICPVEDDTDINCDVCFTFIVRCERVLIVKLSMIGPYAVVLAFGPDGLSSTAELVSCSAEDVRGTTEDEVLRVLRDQGFIFVPRDHLETMVR
ncbi:hypothetical protein [Micromonospora sp. NPDC093277]|uniref:hypothetical protein n=1 Tax=Micromonospora sp. NPDC093277 TaxID=3364291 RepID=UPI003815987D